MGTHTRKVLFLSDLHRGGRSSNAAFFEPRLRSHLQHYDDVVLLGDMVELTFIDPNYAKDLHHRLRKCLRHLDKDFRGVPPERRKQLSNEEQQALEAADYLTEKYKDMKAADIAKMVMKDHIWWLDSLIKYNKHCRFHKVLGNHGNVDEFRDALDRLKAKYPDRFEWDPEAIRIGDALCTHGDLQLDKQTDATRKSSSLDDAHRFQRWEGLISIGRHFNQVVESHSLRPEKTIKKIAKHMDAHDGTSTFFYLHDGTRKPLTMDWVKRVFTGHTHVHFNNERLSAGKKELIDKYRHIQFYNTGAMTTEVSRSDQVPGVLEAELCTDTQTLSRIKLVDVRHFAKDKETVSHGDHSQNGNGALAHSNGVHSNGVHSNGVHPERFARERSQRVTTGSADRSRAGMPR